MVSDFNQKIKELRSKKAKTAAFEWKKRNDKETIASVLTTLS